MMSTRAIDTANILAEIITKDLGGSPKFDEFRVSRPYFSCPRDKEVVDILYYNEGSVQEAETVACDELLYHLLRQLPGHISE